MTNIGAAVETLSEFIGAGLTARIGDLERQFEGVARDRVKELLTSARISTELLSSAQLLKNIAGQINVVIHALGILLALPKVLKPDEKVEYLSLGAGNTGRAFDLETNKRVAEFKFIRWQGGSETIRQNALFKDFYLLAEHDTTKQKCMFVIGTEHPLRFLRSGRTLTSVMSRHRALWEGFQARYGTRFERVRDYYEFRQTTVELIDVQDYLDVPDEVVSAPYDPQDME